MILRRFFPRIEVLEGDKEDAWQAGANGQNGLFRIWFWSGIPDREEVAAEELYEWRWNWTWRPIFGLLTGAPAAAVLWFLAPEILLFALVAFMAGFVLGPQLHFMQRRKELMSHEIGTQIAVSLKGMDAAAYRWAEIGHVDRRDLGGMVTYPWLKGMSEAEIFAGMERNADRARNWVKRNRDFIDQVRRLPA